VATLLLLALPLSTSAEASSPRHVHLSWESDPSRAVTVTWRSDSVVASIVEYGLNESYGLLAVGEPAVVHAVQLVNLTPATTYHYRCGDGATWSGRYNFTTGPVDGVDGFSFAVVGDDRGSYAVRRSVNLAVLDVEADFMIHTGDLVNDGGIQQNWDLWFESGEGLHSGVPVMPALGNHEEMAPRYFEQFSLPGNEQWYSFDYGNAHFIALSTETAMLGDQLRWLEEDLAACDSEWRFVYFHRPMYSSGYHGSDLSVRRAWEKALSEGQVDIVFSGHDHIYERTEPVLSGRTADPPEGIVHVVTGGGGAGLHDLSPVQPSWSAVRLSEYHHVLVEIRGGALHYEARLPDGTIFDQFDIHKGQFPDLRVVSLGADPTHPSPGKAAEIVISVANAGQIESGNFRVDITLDGTVYSTIGSSSLGPGEESQLEVAWTPTEQGDVEVGVSVDPGDEVYEGLEEGNNDLSTTVYVSEPMPDLMVKEITCTPAPPFPDQPITLLVSVSNLGDEPAASFTVSVLIAGIPNHAVQINDLPGGALAHLEVPWTTGPGDWEVMVTVDVAGEVEEIREDNNVESRLFHVRDLVRIGGAYVPRGVPDDGPSVVYYDVRQGPMSTSPPGVVIVWGIDGWKRPPGELATPQTLTLSRTFETGMTRFAEDLYVALLPSSPEIQGIDLKFQDRHLVPAIVDDHGGANWRIVGRPWVEGLLSDLSNATLEAGAAGVDVSGYANLTATAGQLLTTGDYHGITLLIGNSTFELRMMEALAILQMATLEFNAALAEDLELGRIGIYLTGAATELDRENHLRSKQLSLQVIGLIEEIRAEVGEVGSLILYLALAAVLPALNRPRQ
jgi:hypothetical protein